MEPFQKNFADVANFARGKTIRTLFYTFYMFYTAKSNPRFRVFGVFRGSQSNQKQETRNQKPETKQERNNMKLEIDWFEMAKAVAKAIWPFVAGAFGGLFSGCTFGGIGPNFLA